MKLQLHPTLLIFAIGTIGTTPTVAKLGNQNNRNNRNDRNHRNLAIIEGRLLCNPCESDTLACNATTVSPTDVLSTTDVTCTCPSLCPEGKFECDLAPALPADTDAVFQGLIDDGGDGVGAVCKYNSAVGGTAECYQECAPGPARKVVCGDCTAEEMTCEVYEESVEGVVDEWTCECPTGCGAGVGDGVFSCSGVDVAPDGDFPVVGPDGVLGQCKPGTDPNTVVCAEKCDPTVIKCTDCDGANSQTCYIVGGDGTVADSYQCTCVACPANLPLGYDSFVCDLSGVDTTGYDVDFTKKGECTLASDTLTCPGQCSSSTPTTSPTKQPTSSPNACVADCDSKLGGTCCGGQVCKENPKNGRFSCFDDGDGCEEDCSKVKSASATCCTAGETCQNINGGKWGCTA